MVKKREIHHLHRRVRNLDGWDLILLKSSVSMFMMILFKLFHPLKEFVNSINVWVFVVLLFVFISRPFYKYWSKVSD